MNYEYVVNVNMAVLIYNYTCVFKKKKRAKKDETCAERLVKCFVQQKFNPPHHYRDVLASIEEVHIPPILVGLTCLRVF